MVRQAVWRVDINVVTDVLFVDMRLLKLDGAMGVRGPVRADVDSMLSSLLEIEEQVAAKNA